MSIYDNYIPMLEDISNYRRDPNLNPQLYIKVRDLIEFVYNGTNWIQIGGVVSI